MQSVVMKRKDLDGYVNGVGYVGAIVGRFGNRIENGKFVLNGTQYQLSQNEEQNTLHGGKKGFDKKVWKVLDFSQNSITMFYQSPDGEEGFPATLDTTVKYSLTEDNQLLMEYFATSDNDTIINLTNHSYFNVNGDHNSTENIKLQISADKITVVDDKLIPHGEFLDVKGTLFDFNEQRPFICDLSSDATLSKRGCYDENFVLKGEGYRKIAQISSELTGIVMEVFTDQPGMQIYTGTKSGIALETQNFPNSINCANFPSPILRKSQTYTAKTSYKFSILKG